MRAVLTAYTLWTGGCCKKFHVLGGNAQGEELPHVHGYVIIDESGEQGDVNCGSELLRGR